MVFILREKNCLRLHLAVHNEKNILPLEQKRVTFVIFFFKKKYDIKTHPFRCQSVF